MLKFLHSVLVHITETPQTAEHRQGRYLIEFANCGSSEVTKRNAHYADDGAIENKG